jgi:hypothetical protein
MSWQKAAGFRGDRALSAINGMLAWKLATTNFRECEPSRKLGE